ncbi:MAG: hypothetical protein GY866_00735 [Proteobacteria bacterium]|nr:hypothetical protein [Pseudomonadota bacterium]
MDHIFNINKNTNRSGTRGEPGNGFGMPLVKKYITLYGGDIEIVTKEEHIDPQDHGTIINMKFLANDPKLKAQENM